MIVLESLFLRISPCDAAEPWQLGFQDAATPMMQGIMDLHHDIFFFLILILFFVFWILVRTFSKLFILKMNGGDKAERRQRRIAAAAGFAQFTGSDDDEDPEKRRRKREAPPKGVYEGLNKPLADLLVNIFEDNQQSPALQGVNLPSRRTLNLLIREALDREYGSSLPNFRRVGQMALALYDLSARREQSSFFLRVIELIRERDS